VFCREDGSPLRPDSLSLHFRAAMPNCSAPTIRFHDLRHTYASLALAAGVQPKVVSDRLGHSTVSLTMNTYSHAIPGVQEDAAARVASLIPGISD
jgi:integrase